MTQNASRPELNLVVSIKVSRSTPASRPLRRCFKTAIQAAMAWLPHCFTTRSTLLPRLYETLMQTAMSAAMNLLCRQLTLTKAAKVSGSLSP